MPAPNRVPEKMTAEVLMPAKDIALANEILRGVVGSTALGTSLDGQDDRDEMGVFIEPPMYVCGLASCDHYIQRDQPSGVRSEPGDLDLTMYSLRKYCRLAAQGNPSVLILLWLPSYLTRLPLGDDLLAIRSAFFSRSAGERFMGYLTSQKLALKGERTKKVSRPDLVEKYGYDTKFAMHALRLGYEGIEYMTERRLTLPTPEPARTTLMDMRTGHIPYADALTLIESVENRLRSIVDKCDVAADFATINDFLVRAHREHWNW